MIKAYFVEWENKVCCGVRYLCDAHAKGVVPLMKKLEIKFFTEIHGDVYDKKCHLVKGGNCGNIKKTKS